MTTPTPVTKESVPQVLYLIEAALAVAVSGLLVGVVAVAVQAFGVAGVALTIGGVGSAVAVLAGLWHSERSVSAGEDE